MITHELCIENAYVVQNLLIGVMWGLLTLIGIKKRINEEEKTDEKHLHY